MADPKLTDYIEDARKKGYSDVKIADSLRKAGYSESHIENSLRKEQSATPAPEKFAKKGNSHSITKPIIIFGVIILVLIVAFLIPWGNFFASTGQDGYNSDVEEIEEGFYISNVVRCREMENLEPGLYDSCVEDNMIKITSKEECASVTDDTHLIILCESILEDDVLLCQNIEDPFYRGYCISVHAIHRNEETICEGIGVEPLVNACKEKVSNPNTINVFKDYQLFFY